MRTGVLLLKLDSGGRIEWNRTFLAGTSGQADAIRITSDGGYVIAGAGTGRQRARLSNWDGYILKTDDQESKNGAVFLRV